MKEGYIPKDQRKKVLLLSDDALLTSGVGVMSKEIMFGTSHHYNWVQLASALRHPDQGKRVDISEYVAQETGVEDASVVRYPYSGYGDAAIVRKLMKDEQPDLIMLFTDPRQWIYFFHIEREVRVTTPVAFYSIWDALPYPKYNESYYRSCDAIFSISRQSHNIVKQVCKNHPFQPWQLKYIPHGMNTNKFFPITDEEGLQKVADMRTKLYQNQEVSFSVLYDSRNIRRKMTGDIIVAYRDFFLRLSNEEREKVRLVMHTQPIDENGTDLVRLIQDCAPEIKVIFSTDRLSADDMNVLYNSCDAVINLSNAEGWGLSVTSALNTGRMIIANVTGGLQDQMGFVDDKGNLLHEDVHYCEEWGSNADGRYRTHGEWVEPVFPNNFSLVGSPATPYIEEQRCSYKDASDAIMKVYQLGPEERTRRGLVGREYALQNGLTAESMCSKFIDGIDTVLKQWTPRSRYDLIKA